MIMECQCRSAKTGLNRTVDMAGLWCDLGPSDPLETNGCGLKPMVPFWGRCSTILVYFSGDWDVHWGYDLEFDPWPNVIFHQTRKRFDLLLRAIRLMSAFRVPSVRFLCSRPLARLAGRDDA